MSLKDRIKLASKRKPVEFFVEHWQEKVWIRILTLSELLHWEREGKVGVGLAGNKDMDVSKVMGLMLAAAIVEEDGSPVFTYDEVIDLDSIATQVLFKECCKVNKIGADDIQDIEKKLASKASKKPGS